MKLFIKIISFFFVPMVIIALIMYLAGVKGPIQLDNTYYNFMQKVSIQSSEWNIAIPDIPKLKPFDNNEWYLIVLNALIGIYNLIATFLNVIISFLNVIISIFTNIASLIKLLFEFENYSSSTSELSWWAKNIRLPILWHI